MGYSALLERTVNKPRSEVFGALNDFGGIGRLVPQICKNVDLAGKGIGAKRTIELNPDSGLEGVVVERVEVAYDERVFSYSIIGENPLPVKDYTAVVELEDAGSGQCRVRYGSNWVPDGMDAGELKTMFETLYGQILDGIEAQ
ncbi:MAG: SRPBCC family protein [Myxococcales bacterium]|nr:SRPBCC family protein [Myxococcales bacterium]